MKLINKVIKVKCSPIIKAVALNKFAHKSLGFGVKFFRRVELEGVSLNLGCVALTSTVEQIRLSILEVRIRGSHLMSARLTSEKGSSLLLYTSGTHFSVFVEFVFCPPVQPSVLSYIQPHAAAPRTALDLDSTAVMKTEAQHSESIHPSKEETTLNMLHLLCHTGICN